LRDLSPELGGSGSLKVQRDEAARLLNNAVNHHGRGTCATVRGGLPFSAFGMCKHRRESENAKACFQLEAVSLSRKIPSRNHGESAAPKTAAGAAAANPPVRAIGYRRSKIEPIARRQESEKQRRRASVKVRRVKKVIRSYALVIVSRCTCPVFQKSRGARCRARRNTGGRRTDILVI
jgi:hypothetical protein